MGTAHQLEASLSPHDPMRLAKFGKYIRSCIRAFLSWQQHMRNLKQTGLLVSFPAGDCGWSKTLPLLASLAVQLPWGSSQHLGVNEREDNGRPSSSWDGVVVSQLSTEPALQQEGRTSYGPRISESNDSKATVEVMTQLCAFFSNGEMQNSLFQWESKLVELSNLETECTSFVFHSYR